MTKVILTITANRKDIFFDCLNHSGDYDVCTIVSTLCNVLVAECLRTGQRPTIYEDGHVRIDIEYAANTTIEVFRAVQDVFEGLQRNHPDSVKIY